MEPDSPDAKLPETALRAELEGAREQVAASDDMEQALRDARAQFEAMGEAFDGIVYVCSQDYVVEYMNRRFIERTGRDATGEKCYRALHDLDGVCEWCVNDRVLKGETVRWGLELGVDYGLTSSCYDPDDDGHPCGHCDSCLLRPKGFEEVGVADPLTYQAE